MEGNDFDQDYDDFYDHLEQQQLEHENWLEMQARPSLEEVRSTFSWDRFEPSPDGTYYGDYLMEDHLPSVRAWLTMQLRWRRVDDRFLHYDKSA